MRKCLGRSLALPIPPERFVGFKSETASKPEADGEWLSFLRHLVAAIVNAVHEPRVAHEKS